MLLNHFYQNLCYSLNYLPKKHFPFILYVYERFLYFVVMKEILLNNV